MVLSIWGEGEEKAVIGNFVKCEGDFWRKERILGRKLQILGNPLEIPFFPRIGAAGEQVHKHTQLP